jgi:DNA-binding protein HU-beta
MTKAELITKIAKINEVDESIVLPIVESFMKTVKRSLSRDENVYLRGFGSFIIKRRAEKKARNISQNTYVIVPAHKLPAFKPATDFEKKIK